MVAKAGFACATRVRTRKYVVVRARLTEMGNPRDWPSGRWKVQYSGRCWKPDVEDKMSKTPPGMGGRTGGRCAESCSSARKLF